MGASTRRASFVWAAVLVGGLLSLSGNVAAQVVGDPGGGGIVIVGADLSGHWDFEMSVLVKSDPTIGDLFTGSFDVTGGAPTYSGTGIFNGRPATIGGTGAVDPTAPTTITLSDHIATTDSETHFTATLMSGDLGTGTFTGGTLDGRQTWSGVFKIKITRTPTQMPAEQIGSAAEVAAEEMRNVERLSVRSLFISLDDGKDRMAALDTRFQIRAAADDVQGIIVSQRLTAIDEMRRSITIARGQFGEIIASVPVEDQRSLRTLARRSASDLEREFAARVSNLNRLAGQVGQWLRKFATIYARLTDVTSSSEAARLFADEIGVEKSKAEAEKTKAEQDAEDDIDKAKPAMTDDEKEASKESMRRFKQIKDREIDQAAAKGQAEVEKAKNSGFDEIREAKNDAITEIKRTLKEATDYFTDRVAKRCALRAYLSTMSVSVENPSINAKIKVKCLYVVHDRPEDLKIHSTLHLHLSFLVDGNEAAQFSQDQPEDAVSDENGSSSYNSTNGDAAVDMSTALGESIFAGKDLEVIVTATLDATCKKGTTAEDLKIFSMKYAISNKGKNAKALSLKEGYPKAIFPTKAAK